MYAHKDSLRQLPDVSLAERSNLVFRLSKSEPAHADLRMQRISKFHCPRREERTHKKEREEQNRED